MNSQIEQHCLMNIVDRPATVMVRGRGSHLWDESGRKYLDFVQGWAVNSLGHAPREVVDALGRQAEMLLTPSPAYHNAPQLELAHRLCGASGLDRATFCSSGAEAIETAIKICRKWGRLHRSGAYEIISTHNAFHGRSLAAMAASGKPGWADLFPPYPRGFHKVEFGNVSKMADAISASTVALLVEPVQGEAGAIEPETGYLRGLRDLADRHELLLVFDEVQTGIGRTGSLFAYEQAGVLPDVVTLGKGLGAGVPLSAVLVNARADVLSPGDHGGTFNGNPLMAAVGCAVLDVVLRPEFLVRVRLRAEQLRAGLERIAHKYAGKVRGRGLLLALELSQPAAEPVRDHCYTCGLLVNAARPNVLRFMPQLRVEAEEIDAMLEILDASLSSVLAPERGDVSPRRSELPHPENKPSTERDRDLAIGSRGSAISGGFRIPTPDG
jgi:acetylornithine/N-succinyldiaminopimelate aminotransferase